MLEDDMQTLSSVPSTPDIVVLTGLSGSGRTQALHVFEDMGYFCIDNLPPRLILQLAELVGINSGIGRHLAVTCDLRSQGLFDELTDCIDQLKNHELSCKLVFLDTATEVLMRRYSENRRRHPLAYPHEDLASVIKRERRQLADVKRQADLVVDTSQLKVQDLKSALQRSFSEYTPQQLLQVQVLSFGFKHGLPAVADLLIDVRFLPNPYYDTELRPLTGNDQPVENYVLTQPATTQFLRSWKQLLDVVMPGYVHEGKSQLTIAIGCTGGQHRSVVLARQTAQYLAQAGYSTALTHRDLPQTQ